MAEKLVPLKYQEGMKLNWLDIDTNPEKVRFTMSVASLCVLYLIPQVAGFYFVARLFMT